MYLSTQLRSRAARRLAIIVGSVALVTAIAGCSATPPAPEPTTTPGDLVTIPSTPDAITIAQTSASISQSLIFLAEDSGTFDDYGIDATLLKSDGAGGALNLVISGSAQFATGAVETSLHAIVQGQKVKMPLRLYSGVPGSLVVSKKVLDDAGITLKDSVEDRFKALEGHTIATPEESSPFTIFVRDGLKSADVNANITYIGTDGLVAAFVAGSVDGFMMSSPLAEQGIEQGDGVKLIDGPAGEFPNTIPGEFFVPLVYSDSYEATHRDVVVRVTAALLATSAWVKAEPDEAKALLRTRFPSFDDALFESIWEGNMSAFENPVPTAKDLEFAMSKIQGADAAQIQALDAEEILDPEIVADAQALVDSLK